MFVFLVLIHILILILCHRQRSVVDDRLLGGCCHALPYLDLNCTVSALRRLWTQPCSYIAQEDDHRAKLETLHRFGMSTNAHGFIGLTWLATFPASVLLDVKEACSVGNELCVCFRSGQTVKEERHGEPRSVSGHPGGCHMQSDEGGGHFGGRSDFDVALGRRS